MLSGFFQVLTVPTYCITEHFIVSNNYFQIFEMNLKIYSKKLKSVYYVTKPTVSELVFSKSVATLFQLWCSIHATRARFLADSDGKVRNRVGYLTRLDSARDREA